MTARATGSPAASRLTGTPVLPGLTDNDVDVTLTGALSQDIQVSASYDYQPIFFPNIPGVVGSGNAGGTFEMNTTIIMRVL